MPYENHNEECWRPVAGWEQYEVSCQGRVYSHWQKRSMHPSLAGAGYLSVRLCDGPRRLRPYVHELVAEAFLGERPEGHEPNHRDGNKTNNRVSNLEWLTHSQNLKHAWASGLFSRLTHAKAG